MMMNAIRCLPHGLSEQGYTSDSCTSRGIPSGSFPYRRASEAGAAASISRLLNEELPEAKPRFLMFSDSVQDAAHRAAVAETRNALSVYQKALYSALHDAETGEMSLHEVIEDVPRAQLAELGPDVPHHFTAFHPDHRMRDVPPTPLRTLVRAREIAIEEGMQFVYTGNLTHPLGEVTRCLGCGNAVIERDRYEVLAYRLTAEGACRQCGTVLPGRFDVRADVFGARRIPITVGA